MSWDKGFNFRLTSGYVTDPTNTTYVLNTDTSPTTRNGVTFVWADNGTGTLDSRDRSTGNDPRLAGINFISNTSSQVGIFQVTLPASGQYDLYLAAGDQAQGGPVDLEWGDNGSYTTIANAHDTVSANSFVDASNAVRTHAQWVADSARGGTARRITMTSTTFQIRIAGLSAVAGLTPLAHVFLSQVSTGGFLSRNYWWGNQ